MAHAGGDGGGVILAGRRLLAARPLQHRPAPAQNSRRTAGSGHRLTSRPILLHRRCQRLGCAYCRGADDGCGAQRFRRARRRRPHCCRSARGRAIMRGFTLLLRLGCLARGLALGADRSSRFSVLLSVWPSCSCARSALRHAVVDEVTALMKWMAEIFLALALCKTSRHSPTPFACRSRRQPTPRKT